MAAHPAQLLVLLLLGFITLAVLLGALYILYKAHRPRIVYRRTHDRSDVTPVATTELVREPHDRPGKTLMLAIALLMLCWVFVGKYAMALFYPGPDQPA